MGIKLSDYIKDPYKVFTENEALEILIAAYGEVDEDGNNSNKD